MSQTIDLSAATGRAAKEAFAEFITPFEGRVPWMYLDTKALVTVGVGNLIDPEQYALDLPFVHKSTGKSATKDEISAEWWRVKSDTSLATRGYRQAEKGVGVAGGWGQPPGGGVVVVGGLVVVGGVVVVGGRVVDDDGGRGGGGGGDGGRDRVVVGLGRWRVVVVRVVVGTGIVSAGWAGGGTCGCGAGLGSDDGTGNGSRLVSTTGELSPGSGTAVAQPSTPSATAAAPAAIAAARGIRRCNEPAPLDGPVRTLCDRANAIRRPTNE